MKFAIIEKNIVTNLVISDPEFASSNGWIECNENVTVGCIYQNGIFEQNKIDYFETNKTTASMLLQSTDWTQSPDVSDIKRKPHLKNAIEFANYREKLRAIAVNPPQEEIVFPIEPDSIWG